MTNFPDNCLNQYTIFSQAELIEALAEWQAIAAQADQLGYADRVRDLSPHIYATKRSIKIRTGKLRRFIESVK